MENDNLVMFQKFFAFDAKIKKEIYDMVAPNDKEYLDNRSLVKYTDNLNNLLKYVFGRFKTLSIELFGKNSHVFNRISALEKVCMKEFYKCGINIDKLRVFYRVFISDMDLDFINSVKSECIGYYAYNQMRSIEKATSINEILHFFHAYIVNNNYLLQTMPFIDEKETPDGGIISYRGVKNDVFEDIFNKFPTDLESDSIDMLSVSDNKLLIMLRDIGHALTIEITLNKDLARVEYFIPKIIKEKAINKLPGVNKINKNSVGATGAFEVSIDRLQETLFDFIKKVPKDTKLLYSSFKSR